MNEELAELMERQAQLRAMKQSCADFEKKLNEDITKFLETHMGVSGDSPVSMLDLIQRASTK